jgi:flagellar hook-basal body complex protein FliE
MAIESIAYLPPVGAPVPDDGGEIVGAPRSSGLDFAGWLQKSLTEANQQIAEADRQVARLAAGDSDNLHQVMIALEEAKLSFQLMVQVRNKLLESYQDILRMQI